jgi:hypothetical protein
MSYKIVGRHFRLAVSIVSVLVLGLTGVVLEATTGTASAQQSGGLHAKPWRKLVSGDSLTVYGRNLTAGDVVVLRWPVPSVPRSPASTSEVSEPRPTGRPGCAGRWRTPGRVPARPAPEPRRPGADHRPPRRPRRHPVRDAPGGPALRDPGHQGARDQLNFANAWHSDLSYLAEPPAYTLLHAWDVPPRWRHGLVQPVPGLRDPLRRAQGDPGRAPGRALGGAGLRDRRLSRQGQGPHLHGHRPSPEAYPNTPTRSSSTTRSPTGPPCTSTPSTRPASTAGRRSSPRSPARPPATATASMRTSPAGCAGPATPWPSGTTAAPCTTP